MTRYVKILRRLGIKFKVAIDITFVSKMGLKVW